MDVLGTRVFTKLVFFASLIPVDVIPPRPRDLLSLLDVVTASPRWR